MLPPTLQASLTGSPSCWVAAALQASSSSGYDVARAARMGTFGLLFYGPYQVRAYLSPRRFCGQQF